MSRVERLRAELANLERAAVALFELAEADPRIWQFLQYQFPMLGRLPIDAIAPVIPLGFSKVREAAERLTLE